MKTEYVSLRKGFLRKEFLRTEFLTLRTEVFLERVTSTKDTFAADRVVTLTLSTEQPRPALPLITEKNPPPTPTPSSLGYNLPEVGNNLRPAPIPRAQSVPPTPDNRLLGTFPRLQ